MLLGKNEEKMANYSQPSFAFETEAEYNAWVATLDSASDVNQFVVYKLWENDGAVNSPVQCYASKADFPATGLKHTLYIDCDELKFYLWQYQSLEYIQVTN